jgi:GTP-binding protein
MARKADLIDSVPSEDGTRRRGVFKIPTRGSVGLRSEMIRKTRGDVIMNLRFLGYEKYRGKITDTRRGVLVSMDTGVTTNYALDLLQERGELFIGVSEQVYCGMIIGECARDQDMDVNPTKQKKLTNIRTTSKEENVRLTPPRQFQLEDYIGYLGDDELLEVTPLRLRLRKSILQTNRRQSSARASAKA